MSSKREAGRRTGGSKRARTSTRDQGSASHAPSCDDSECPGCAAGAVQLDADVLGLPAAELLATAEHEEAEGTDRTVVTKLYEAALAKFAGTQSLPHAWALLRFAEYVDYGEYARQALSMADSAAGDDDGNAQALVIKGRSRVLEVCLDQGNWRDPSDDGAGSGSGDEGAGSRQVQIAGEQALRQGLEELSEGLRLLGNSDADTRTTTAGTVASLAARHEQRSLCGPLRLAIMDSALALAYRSLGWGVDSSGSGAPGADDLTRTACKAAVYWALAASECAVSGSDIEARTGPAAAYLASATADAECLKLHAQILIVLSGTLDDEDAAIGAYDAAVSALEQARRIDPSDADIASQLEDLGVGA